MQKGTLSLGQWKLKFLWVRNHEVISKIAENVLWYLSESKVSQYFYVRCNLAATYAFARGCNLAATYAFARVM